MATSAQEQLLKAGLVDEKKLKQASKEKRKQSRQQQKAKGKKAAAKSRQPSAASLARAAQVERDRRISLDQQRERERKARQAQIRQMVEQHQVERIEGDLGYQFTDGRKIKKLMLNAEQHAQVVNGQLAIVRAPLGFALVKPETARKIAERDASWLLVLNEPDKDEKPAEDDPYAEFQVPDDLMW